jgi:tetratricopeptide (TPR) repeat protein
MAMGDVSEFLQLAQRALGAGRVRDAAAALARAVEAQPGNAILRNNLGVLLEQLGQFEAALASYDAALARDASRADVHCNRANVLKALGRDPVAGYRAALARDPNHIRATHNLGVCLRELGQRDDAEPLLRRAVTLAPNSVDALVNLGALLQSKGAPNEALDCYARAAALDPNSAEAAAGETMILEQRGDFEQACARIAQAFAAGPSHPDVAVAFASVAGKLRRHEEAIRALEAADARAGVGGDKRQAILFALGKLLDGAGRYAEAWAAFERGNALHPRKFNRAAFTRMAEEVRARFPAGAFPGAAPEGHPSEQPIFIVGMPRSGTTLVEQILASHPEATGAGELPHIEQLALSGRAPAACAAEYLALLDAAGHGARRIADKMPGNFMHLGFIAAMFPRAHIVHIAREPLDTCLSCYFQHFNDGHEYSYDLADLAFVFREYERMMGHWHALGLRMLELRYEDIVTAQERETRRLLEFCGLPWDASCLRFHETRRLVRTASYDQVRQPLYARSVGRHRHYEAFIARLRDALATA